MIHLIKKNPDIKIFFWNSRSKKKLFLTKDFSKQINNLKKDSLICRLSPSLLRKYFDKVTSTGGKVIVAFDKKGENIAGLIVYNLIGKTTFSFFWTRF